jgi:hypothetical protein
MELRNGTALDQTGFWRVSPLSELGVNLFEKRDQSSPERFEAHCPCLGDGSIFAKCLFIQVT